MHELSIAYNLVEVAADAAKTAGVQHVDVVHLRLGALAGVVKDALLFGYEIAAAGTLLEGSRLAVEEIPVAIFCPSCAVTSVLDTIQLLRCPLCGQLSGDIRQGRELEIIALEIAEAVHEYDEQSAHS